MNLDITPQEAMVYIMVLVSAADRDMNEMELTRMGRLVSFLPVFDDFDTDELPAATQRCQALLMDQDGMHVVLEIIKDAIPARLYDTAYAIAVEIASADLNVRTEEIRVLQLLRDRLSLDKLTCAAIERGAIARFRGAG